MDIGSRIKELRIKNKITQEELSKTLQVSTQAVSKWENGGSPDLELIPLIATYFKVSTDFLFDQKQNEIIDIEDKLYNYLISFKLEDRVKVLYKLCFNMSIATRGEKIEDVNKFESMINNEDLYSNIIGENGIIITSLVKDNKLFLCLPKDNRSDYSKILQSKNKQRKFCEYLSDELFYNTLVFLYTRNGGDFTEQLLIDNFKITYEEAKIVLQKMKEFNIVQCANVPINDTTIELYTVLSNPQIVGAIALLDMIVNKPTSYCYYFGGPTNYFKK